MNLRTEKEDLIYELNRANKLCEEATLNYMNMCKRVEVLEKCVNEIEEICKHETINLTDSCVSGGRYFEILQKIKEVKGDE